MKVNKTNIKDLAVASEFPQLFGIDDFRPSLLQCKALIAWLDSPTADTPSVTIKNLGHNYHNWYIWQKQDGFQAWWNECIDRSFQASDLRKLYKALLNRGLSNDTAAGKIFIQKYDPEFTERSSGDTRHSFAGFTPHDEQSTADAVERSRKRIESEAIETPPPDPEPPDIEQPPEPVEPDHRRRLAAMNQASRERIAAQHTASDTQDTAEHATQPDAHAHTPAREDDDTGGGRGRGYG